MCGNVICKLYIIPNRKLYVLFSRLHSIMRRKMHIHTLLMFIQLAQSNELNLNMLYFLYFNSRFLYWFLLIYYYTGYYNNILYCVSHNASWSTYYNALHTYLFYN